MSDSKNKLKASRLTAEQIMKTEVVSAQLFDFVRDVTKLLIDLRISGVPIVDQYRTFYSVVTEIDLMKFIAAGGLDQPLNHFTLQLPKKKDLVTVHKQDSFRDVFRCFLVNPVKRVFVLDSNDAVVGVISRRDVLAAFIETESDISEI